MTSHYLTNITPDSISGIIFTYEGIRGSIVLMNGPTGCKYYHSAISDSQMLRGTDFDPLNYPELMYFGQPRVPCTYLDTRDYIYGSREKLEEALHYFCSSTDFDIIFIVNSPGAALIGDDIAAIAAAAAPGRTVITIESPGYSKTEWYGADFACREMILQLLPLIKRQKKHPSERPCANLLGFSIFQKNHEGDLLEIKRLLNLCGIDVSCSLCCGCTPEEIKNLASADLNIVVNASYGRGTAELLAKECGTPYMECRGIPVGFPGMEELIKDVCRRLNVSPAGALEELEKARARAYIYLSRLDSLTGLPKSVPFAIQGTVSQCLGYCRFLIRYLGMAADCVAVLSPDRNDPEYRDLYDLLSSKNMADALEKDILSTDAQLVFADGSIIAKLKFMKHDFSGIEINLPSIGYVDIVPKTHIGAAGGLALTEQVINGLMF